MKTQTRADGKTSQKNEHIICSMEVWNRLEEMDSRIRTLAKVLTDEINRNQESDERIAKIFEKLNKLPLLQFKEVSN